MRYWPLAKFQELLMQLSVYGIKPDTRVVQPGQSDFYFTRKDEEGLSARKFNILCMCVCFFFHQCFFVYFQEKKVQA
jgi:hypothetical protein